MQKPLINIFEYQFLKDQWEGPFGAAYNAAAEFCSERGLWNGFTAEQVPILSERGEAAVAEFEDWYFEEPRLGLDNDSA